MTRAPHKVVDTLDEQKGRGELRSAIEGLLRNCAELDQRSAESGREARDAAHGVARELAGLKLPGLEGLADEIVGMGAKMEADLVTNLAEARRPYLDEVHQLLALLAPHHGVVDTLPPLSVTGGAIRSADTFAEQFPAVFARRYVFDLVDSVEHSLTLTVDDAGRIQIVPSEHVASATAAAGAALDETHREEGTKLLEDGVSHTVEQHGPQIPDEAQLARLIWLKDPTGEYSWNVTPQGAVATDHWAGTTTGGFTSPEALAKPVNTLLRVASEHAGGLHGLLDNQTDETRISIHITAEQCGLEPGDASGYRGAGTGTRETFRDWKKARSLGIENGTATVYGVPYDPIEKGTDPGAMVVLKWQNERWHLVTCFPVGEHRPKIKRLEELS